MQPEVVTNPFVLFSHRTGYTSNVHWIVPTLSGIMSGFGLMSIMLQSMNYLVDAYLMLYVFDPFFYVPILLQSAFTNQKPFNNVVLHLC